MTPVAPFDQVNVAVKGNRTKRRPRQPLPPQDARNGITEAEKLGPGSVEVQTWLIDKLVIYARNPRKNDDAVDRMCGSIREFGFKIPCLARSNGELTPVSWAFPRYR